MRGECPLHRDFGIIEAKLDYVGVLHVGQSTSVYPDLYNTGGMNVIFELLENGEIAGADAAYFRTTSVSYTVQPKRVGDFVVRATATDNYGNTFTFTTQIHVVPVASAEITEIPTTAVVGHSVTIGVTPKNITNESVVWAISYLSEEAGLPHISSGLQQLWCTASGWEERNIEDAVEGTLLRQRKCCIFFPLVYGTVFPSALPVPPEAAKPLLCRGC